jgi:hypothetical protein
VSAPTDHDPVLVLLWIMERMDGVSLEWLARRERMRTSTMRDILVAWGCPPTRYRMRSEYHEALALWNTGAFTWDEVAEEARINMDGKTLRGAVLLWARRMGLPYAVGRQRGARPKRRQRVDAA